MSNGLSVDISPDEYESLCNIHEIVQEFDIEIADMSVHADLIIANKFLVKVHDKAVDVAMNKKPISTIY